MNVLWKMISKVIVVAAALLFSPITTTAKSNHQRDLHPSHHEFLSIADFEKFPLLNEVRLDMWFSRVHP